MFHIYLQRGYGVKTTFQNDKIGVYVFVEGSREQADRKIQELNSSFPEGTDKLVHNAEYPTLPDDNPFPFRWIRGEYATVHTYCKAMKQPASVHIYYANGDHVTLLHICGSKCR